MRRRLLIISPTFYPDPMVAAVRMTQFARHLPALGWEVRVLCRHYGYEATDLPDGVSVRYLSPAPQKPAGGAHRPPSSLRRMLAWLAFVPDPSIRFWRSAMPRVLHEAREYRPHLVLTSSPPTGVHAVGLEVKRQLSIPWVLDWREAYLADRRYRPPGVAKVRWPAHLAFERTLYEQADLILHQLPVHHRWARRRYPTAYPRSRELINGFAHELVDGTIQPRHSSRRSIRLIGNVAGGDLLRLTRAVRHVVDQGDDAELIYVGRRPIDEAPYRALLGDRLTITGFVPHDDAMAYQLGADLLINFIDPVRAQSAILSTKLVEYIATGRPVLEINPTASDRMFAKSWPQVRYLTAPTDGQLVEALVKTSHPPDQQQLTAYRQRLTWSAQVAQLASWLDQVTP